MNEQKRSRIFLLCLLALTVVVYVGTLQFGFIYDDHQVLEQNPMVTSWGNLVANFTDNLWAFAGIKSAYYRPVFADLWIVLYHLFGLNPIGWHLVNVLLHASVTTLVYFLARRLLAKEVQSAAWMAALLFALHPVHVETVSWVAASCDLLMTMFAVSALICFLRSEDGPSSSWKWKILGAICFSLSMLSKEPGITTAGMAALLIWTKPDIAQPPVSFLNKFRMTTIAMLPWGVLAVLYLLARRVVLGGSAPIPPIPPFLQVMQTWPWLLWFYIKKLLWPVESSAFYDAPYVSQLTWNEFWLPLIGTLALITAIVIWMRRVHNPRIGVFALWMLLPILPQWELRVFSQNDFAHDRYLYLPSVGFCLLAGLAWSAIADRVNQRGISEVKAFIVTAVLLTAVLAPLTVLESSNWANDLVLNSHAVQVAKVYNEEALTNLGSELMKRQMYDDALKVYSQVAARKPGWWQAHQNIGLALFMLGRLDEADEVFRKTALMTNVPRQEPLLFLGYTRMKAGHYSGAEAALRSALEEARNEKVGDETKFSIALAACLLEEGKTDPEKLREALPVLQKIHEQNPKDESINKAIKKTEDDLNGAKKKISK